MVLVSPSSVCVLRSYPFQILDQTLLVCIAEIQLEVPVVVIHDLEQGGKAAVVEEAALLMRLQSRERRGAVPPTSTTRLYADSLAGVRGLRLIFVIDSPSAAINFHVLDKRVVNGDNLGGDGAANRIDVSNF